MKNYISEKMCFHEKRRRKKNIYQYINSKIISCVRVMRMRYGRRKVKKNNTSNSITSNCIYIFEYTERKVRKKKIRISLREIFSYTFYASLSSNRKLFDMSSWMQISPFISALSHLCCLIFSSMVMHIWCVCECLQRRSLPSH